MEPHRAETANKPTRKEHGTVEKEEADEGEEPRQTAREGEHNVAKDAENKKNVIHFSICACHPCAGAMLIFSVSFQF